MNTETKTLEPGERPIQLFSLQPAGFATVGRESANDLFQAGDSTTNKFHVSENSDPADVVSPSMTNPYNVISERFSVSAFRVKPIDNPAASRCRQDAPRPDGEFEPQARSRAAKKRELRRITSAPDANKMMQPHLESQLHRRRLVENPGRQARHLRAVRHLSPQPQQGMLFESFHKLPFKPVFRTSSFRCTAGAPFAPDAASPTDCSR